VQILFPINFNGLLRNISFVTRRRVAKKTGDIIADPALTTGDFLIHSRLPMPVGALATRNRESRSVFALNKASCMPEPGNVGLTKIALYLQGVVPSPASRLFARAACCRNARYEW
jgi:hypothetical protein